MVKFIKNGVKDYKILMRSVPAVAVTFFVVSVVLMNLLANRELDLGIPWLALDCGFFVSWMSFLAMDMLTKRFGAKAAIKISVFALGVNLVVSGVLFAVTKLAGNWGEFYNYENPDINKALDATFGGTWYVLLGSSIAFLVSAVVNALLNEGIGKHLKKNNFAVFALRSYVSTIVGQFVDNMVFALIVSHTFFGWTMTQCITCSITGCIFELLCEVIFSPIGYKASKKWEQNGVGDEYLHYRKQVKE